MPKKPKLLNSQIVAQSNIFTIEQMDLQFTNGETRVYERLCFRGQGAVMIVPMLDDDQVLLVREYAAGLDSYELGLPKGLIEAGEEVADAANREMQEEIGYGAKRFTPMNPLAAAPGYLTLKMDVVLAQDLYPSKLIGDEPEEIEVVPWRLSQLDQLLQRDDVHEARSIAALFMVRELLAKP